MNAINLKDNNSSVRNKHMASTSRPVSFNGLNRCLSKRLLETSDSFEKLSNCCKKSNGIIGNLPAEWIFNIPKEDRAKAIKQFYSDFGKVIVKFAKQSQDQCGKVSSPSKGDLVQYYSEKMKNLSDEATLIFKKAKIIGEDHSIKIESFSNNTGSFGEVFKLSGPFKDSYALKNFKTQVLSKEEEFLFPPNYLYTNSSAGEAGRAAFIQKHTGKNSQMVPFFFSDTNSSYMLNKFIDDSVPKPKRNVPLEMFGLDNPDCSRLLDDGKNKMHGYQIDYGSIALKNRVISQDKELQKIYSKIINKEGKENKEAITKFLASTGNETKKKLIKSFDPFILNKCPSMIFAVVEQSDKEVCSALSKKLLELKNVSLYSNFSVACGLKQVKKFLGINFSKNK